MSNLFEIDFSEKIAELNWTNSVYFTWENGEENLPTENGIYAVLCRNKNPKEGEMVEWFSFAEFIKSPSFAKIGLPNVDYDEWRVLGTSGGSYARGSVDNWYNVIAWAKISTNNPKL